ncbi:MAG: hypothetical protein K1000chlam1_00238 [Candidatus Anoxychlamydiales bacterium]|nr:hypothetical protein [Candidatus Anoxychlamydiales bacterium]
MSDYVLVHGGNLSTDTWNNLTKRNDYPPGEHLGGKIWNQTVTALKKKSHKVFAPTLLEEHNYNLSNHQDTHSTVLAIFKITSFLYNLI